MAYAAVGVAVSGAIFYTIHAFAKPPPRTMTKEWQEATNEYLRVCSPLWNSGRGDLLALYADFITVRKVQPNLWYQQ